MAIFIVVTNLANHPLDDAVKSVFPTNFKIADNVWMVESSETAEQVSNKLGVIPRSDNAKPGSVYGSIFVGKLSTNYWGYWPAVLWDWIKSAFERGN